MDLRLVCPDKGGYVGPVVKVWDGTVAVLSNFVFGAERCFHEDGAVLNVVHAVINTSGRRLQHEEEMYVVNKWA